MKRKIQIVSVISILVIGFIALNNSISSNQTTRDTISDPTTLTEYESWLHQGTQFNGNVWTDKSIATTPQTITMNAGEKTLSPANNQFLVSLSAMSQTYSVTSEVKVPTDTVFVLDMSSSMHTNMGDRTRVAAMVKAANNAIRLLLTANPENRIGVVAYANQATMVSDLKTLTEHGRGDNEDHLIYHEKEGVLSIEGTTNTVPTASGTNTHQGIYVGSTMLNHATKTTITIDGQEISRIPTLILLSDGAATLSVDGEDWREATSKTTLGRTSFVFSGNGFLAALTAAYYKEIIPIHYGVDSMKIYTIGVGLGNYNTDVNNSNESPKAARYSHLVLNPSQYLEDSNNTFAQEFKSYWQAYTNQDDFSIVVNNKENTKNEYLFENANNIFIKPTSLSYNDAYYDSDDEESLYEAFEEIVKEIENKKPSYPTETDDYTPNLSGYVHFTDELGEYMEVKHIHGVLSHDYFSSGASFSKLVQENVHHDTPQMQEVYDLIRQRITALGGDISLSQAKQLVQESVAYQQIYYVNEEEYHNSMAWYTNDTGAFLGFVPYPQKAVTLENPGDATYPVPTKATKVMQSYTYWNEDIELSIGEKGNLMYMTIGVETDLHTGKQTVKMSMPASLVPMTQIHLAKQADGSIDTENCTVNTWSPHRLIYEVGLRHDINEINIHEKVSDEYLTHNLANDSQTAYHFYTNDWERQTKQAKTHTFFTPSKENNFYYFTANTPLYTKQDDSYIPLTTLPNEGEQYYYEYTYYTYQIINDGDNDRISDIKELSIFLTVPIVSNENQDIGITINDIFSLDSGEQYIKKGTKRISSFSNTLIAKEANPTQTSSSSFISSWNHKDTIETTQLGNNGRLRIEAKKNKEVSNDIGENIDDDSVYVGQRLTYTIRYFNDSDTIQTMHIKDHVSSGLTVDTTTISDQGTYDASSHTIHWSIENMAPSQQGSVSFVATVTEEALQDGEIINQAYVNDIATIEVQNPVLPSGKLTISKTVTGNNQDLEQPFECIVTFTDEHGENINTAFPYTKNGQSFILDPLGSITLKHEESLTFYGLPEGIHYEVYEKETPYYKALYVQEKGTISIKKESTTEITNNYTSTSTTPITTNDMTVFILLLLLFSISFFLFIYVGKKHIKE